MTALAEIQKAISQLNPADLAQFCQWFSEFDAAAWDRQLERDIADGRLDALAAEALDCVATITNANHDRSVKPE